MVQVFFIRGGKLIGRDHFLSERLPEEETTKETLSSFIKQFYAGTPYIPSELMLPEEIDDLELIEEVADDKEGAEGSSKGAEKRNEGKTGGAGRQECKDGLKYGQGAV